MAGQVGKKKSVLVKYLNAAMKGKSFDYDFTYLNKEKWWKSFKDEDEDNLNIVENYKVETEE
jgi:hypothetical protein